MRLKVPINLDYPSYPGQSTTAFWLLKAPCALFKVPPPRDNFFYFSIINGKNKHYKDEDSENSLTFYDLAKFKDSEFKLEDIQPNDEQYLTSLKNNATILKKYGHDILIGEEWI